MVKKLSFILLAVFFTALSCATDSSLTGRGNSERSSEFSTGSPIDIPAPIAKVIPGVDPTSIFIEDGMLNGSVSGCSVDEGKTYTVGVVADTDDDGMGEFIDTVPATDCVFQVDVTGLLGDTIALSVFGPTTTTENGGPVSSPVVVAINEDGSFTVSSVNIPFTIQNSAVVISTNDLVAFSYVNDSGENCVGTVPLKGSTTEELACGFPNPLQSLQYDPNGILYGIDRVTGDVYSIEPDGSVSSSSGESISNSSLKKKAVVRLSTDDIAEKSIRLSPSGERLAFIIKSENGLRVIGWDVVNEVKIPTCGWDEEQTFVSVEWENDKYLIGIIQQNANGPYVIWRCNTSENTAEFILEHAEYMGNPIMMPDTKGFIYEYTTSSGKMGIRFTDAESKSSTLLVNGEGYASYAIIMPQRKAIAYQWTSADGTQDQIRVVLYGLDSYGTPEITSSAMAIAYGVKPSLSPNYENYFAYLCLVNDRSTTCMCNTNYTKIISKEEIPNDGDEGDEPATEDDGSSEEVDDAVDTDSGDQPEAGNSGTPDSSESAVATCNAKEVSSCDAVEDQITCESRYVSNCGNSEDGLLHYYNCTWKKSAPSVCLSAGSRSAEDVCIFSGGTTCNANEVGYCSDIGDKVTCRKAFMRYYLNPDGSLKKTGDSTCFDYHNCSWDAEFGCVGTGALDNTAAYGSNRCLPE